MEKFCRRSNCKRWRIVNMGTPPSDDRRKQHRQHGYVLRVVSRFRPDEFKLFFRVTRTVVESLEEWIHRICLECDIASIVGRQGMGGSKPKTLYEHLIMMLWYLDSQDKYSAIADRFGVSDQM